MILTPVLSRTVLAEGEGRVVSFSFLSSFQSSPNHVAIPPHRSHLGVGGKEKNKRNFVLH